MRQFVQRIVFMLTLGGLLLSAATVEAVQMSVVGNARGCFGLGCVAAEAAAIVLSGVPLSFTSAPVDFTGLTSELDPEGVLAINTQGTSTTGNFGLISVGTATPETTISTPFTLVVSFINPITGDATFDAVISGDISVLGAGGILVDFDPAPGPANINETSAPLAFFDPISGVSGTLTVTAFGDPIPSGGQGELRGFITAVANVPEPMTMLLLGGGLAGLAGIARFRSRRKTD